MKKYSSIIVSIVAIGIGFLAAPLRAEFAYVVNQHDNTVSGYSVDGKTGALTPVPGSPFETGSRPFTVTVDPIAAFEAYVVNSDSNSVSVYSINRRSGALIPVPGSPFPTESSPTRQQWTPVESSSM
jgi:6-phosphogluconolactonase (cycloisomerase 2 family)